MTDKRLYHSIADKIMGLIHDGTYPPGSRLPGERELAEQFGVSRVTIREAEIALQAMGQVNIKTGSGVYVLDRSGSPDNRVPNVSAFELTEARSMFESEVAALAATNIDDDTLARLTELIRIMSSDDPSDEAASQQADREFHLTLAAATGNAAVQFIVDILWKMRNELPSVSEVYGAVCSKETAYDREHEHSAILEAIRRRDSMAARIAMQNHFTRLLTTMIDVTEERALEELRLKAKQSRKRYLDNGFSSHTG